MVSDCPSYIRARRAGVSPAETVAARLALSEYVVCDADEALRCARGTGVVGIPRERGRELATRLDLRQLPSSLGPRLDATTHTLATLGDPLRMSDTDVSLATADWLFRLQVAAEADVDRDGAADWILWLTDEARDGNYRNYATFVVLAPARPGPLRAIAWPPVGDSACQ